MEVNSRSVVAASSWLTLQAASTSRAPRAGHTIRRIGKPGSNDATPRFAHRAEYKSRRVIQTEVRQIRRVRDPPTRSA